MLNDGCQKILITGCLVADCLVTGCLAWRGVGCLEPPTTNLGRLSCLVRRHGEVSEWFKEHAWKACVWDSLHRGFESLSLRHIDIVWLVSIASRE